MERKGIPKMSDSTLETARQAAQTAADGKQPGLPSRYRQDHQNPVNHFLHVGVGWPMVAIAVILLPFRPFWSLGLFVSAYAIMFFGHFVFERNIPTIFKEPSTPFVMAFAVMRQILVAARILPSRVQAIRAYDDPRREG
jgi:hypothetical protein